MDTEADRPSWTLDENLEQLFVEDDALFAARDPDRETADSEWPKLFDGEEMPRTGETIVHSEACNERERWERKFCDELGCDIRPAQYDEKWDGGDCDYFRFGDRVYVNSYDGGSIYRIKAKTS